MLTHHCGGDMVTYYCGGDWYLYQCGGDYLSSEPPWISTPDMPLCTQRCITQWQETDELELILLLSVHIRLNLGFLSVLRA